MKVIRQIVCVFVMIALSAVSAWADTEVRPATQFEQAYILRVLTGFDEALSQGPSGWTEIDRTETKAPEHLAVGAAWGPLQVNYRAEWEDRAAKQAEAERREQASRSIEMPDEDVMTEISRKMEELSREMALAAQNGDRAAMQRLQQEAEKLAARSQAAFASTDAQIRQIQKNSRKDMDIKIHCAANTFNKTLSKPAAQASVSGLTVYRVEEENDEADIPGASYVFLGDWQMDEQMDYTTFSVEPRADRIPASVQTVVVSIRAEDKLARKMLETMNWQVLRNLIAK